MAEKPTQQTAEEGVSSSSGCVLLSVPSASTTVSKSPAARDLGSVDVRAFSCAICLENFDKEVRYPVSLLCGHTFCSKCLKTMGRNKPTIMCGVCRKHTRSSYKRLGKNILLIDLMEKSRLLAEVNEADAQQTSDASSSVGSRSEYGGDERRRHRSSSPSLFNNDGLEELYEVLDTIEDSISLAPNEELARSRELRLDGFRNEVSRLERKIGEAQRDYNSLAERARQMEAEVVPSNDQWEEAEARRRTLFNTLMRLHPYQRQNRNFGNHAFNDGSGWSLDDDLSSAGAVGDQESHLDVPLHALFLMTQQAGGQNRDGGHWLNNNYMRFEEASRVHCYLCDCYFSINVDAPGDVSLNEDIRRHIRGHRHQNLLRENIMGLQSEDFGQSNNFPSIVTTNANGNDDRQIGSHHPSLYVPATRLEQLPGRPAARMFDAERNRHSHAGFPIPSIPLIRTGNHHNTHTRNNRTINGRPVFVGDDLISFYDDDDTASVDSTGLGNIAGFNRQMPSNPLDTSSTVELSRLTPRAPTNSNSTPQSGEHLISSIWGSGSPRSPNRYPSQSTRGHDGASGFSNLNSRPSPSSMNNGNRPRTMGETPPRRQHPNSGGGRGRHAEMAQSRVGAGGFSNATMTPRPARERLETVAQATPSTRE